MIIQPDLILKPFADEGDVAAPPQTSPGGFVNFTDGYTPFYEISLAANNPQAKAVERNVQNYMFNALTKNAKAWQNHAVPVWFANMPGGYNRNAQVLRLNSNGVYRLYRAVVDGASADPLTSPQWEYVQTSSEMIRNIPAPMGGATGPSGAVITTPTNFDILLNGTFEIASDAVAQGSPNAPSIPGYSNALAGVLEAWSWQAGTASIVQIQRYTDRAGIIIARSAINGSFGSWQSPAMLAHLQTGTAVYVNATASAPNAYFATSTPTFSVTDGTEIRVTWANQFPNTGPSTFNLNNSGVGNILAVNGQQLQGGEINAGGAATLRFRVNVGWLLMDTWQGNYPVMAATQSRHAVPLSQVQQMIADAKITEVTWSNVTQKPNVAVQFTSPVFSAISLQSQSPFMDFYFGNQNSYVDARIISEGRNVLSFYTNVSGTPVRPLYLSGTLAQFQVPVAMNSGLMVPSLSKIFFNSTDNGTTYYFTNHDELNWALYGDAVGTNVLCVFNRATRILNLYARPVWAGLTPWDNGNLNPSEYRKINNYTFDEQVILKRGSAYSAPQYFISSGGVQQASVSTDASGFYINQVNASGVNLTNFVLNSTTRQAAFAARPTFNGATPWDTANFTPSEYRRMDNNSFSLPVGLNGGASCYAPFFMGTANGALQASFSCDANGFYINSYPDAGGASTNLIINRNTGRVNLKLRPTWEGVTPWDTGNLNPAAYAVLNAANAAFITLQNATPSFAELSGGSAGSPGSLRVATGGAQPNASAVINFFRDSYYGTYLGLDTDNIMKIGGWSGGAASPILTAANLATYLPNALAAQPFNGIGQYGMFVAYGLPSPQAPGGTAGGAALRYTASDGVSQAGSPGAGTWRMLGMIADADGTSPNSTTVWQRIA